MKKTIKINFKYFPEGFNPKDNFFTNILRKNYNVVIDENPDCLFYSVYPESKNLPRDLSKKGDIIRKISPMLYIILRKIYSKLNSIFKPSRLQPPKGNFIKIFYASEHVKPKMEECDWAFGSHFEEEINHPRYIRLPIYIVTDYNLKNLGIPPIKKKINFEKIKREKTKFCNFIYSQDIAFRNDFFKKLSKYKEIDAPGRCMNNMPSIGGYSSPKKSRSSDGWVIEKLKFLKPYKFTIAFENASSPGWVTEKLTNPMLVNSIPIFFGDKSVYRDFNTKSFINYHDFENMEEFIKHIIKVDKDNELYKKYLEQPFYNGNKIPKYMNSKYYLKILAKILEEKLTRKRIKPGLV